MSGIKVITYNNNIGTFYELLLCNMYLSMGLFNFKMPKLFYNFKQVIKIVIQVIQLV